MSSGSFTTAVDVLLILSNLAFIIPSIKAAQLNHFTYATLYVLMMLASGFYHACKSFSSLCIFDAETLRRCDFFFAQLLIFASALYLIEFSLYYQWIARVLLIGVFPVTLFVLQMVFDGELLVQLVVAAVAASIVFIYWWWYKHTKQRGGSLPPYDWVMFTMAIALVTLSVSLFSTQSLWPLGYAYIHSAWHINAALGQYFLLMTRKAAPRLAAIDTKIYPLVRKERHGLK